MYVCISCTLFVHYVHASLFPFCIFVHVRVIVPQTELAMRGSYGLGKGPLKGGRGHSSFMFDQQNQYLVTLALVSSRRNRWSQAQASIFTIENQHFLVQMAPQASWPRDVPAESLEARSPQPAVFSQASSCLLYTSPSPRDRTRSRMPSSA